MRLCVSELNDSGSGVELKLEEDAAAFPVLAELQQSGGADFLTPVTVVLHASSLGGMVEIQGHITVSVELPCSRCLAPCLTEISADFRQTYVDQLPEVTGEDGEELELSAADMGLELFADDQIDLVEEIQQQLLLLLPAHPLCSKSCKGLCADCGADLNKEKCNCASKVVSLNFAALKDFKVEK